MKTITVKGFELQKEITGQCILSELQWSENVEDFHHLKNGQYATTQTPTKHFEEVWEVEGEKINVYKYIRQIGKWINGKNEKIFKSTGESIEYVVFPEDYEILVSI